MTLIEEKTLADHDINVRSIRQELQLLEEQLKKHGRNESSQSPTVQPNTDTISRKQTLEHLKKRLYESALNNDGIASYTFEEIADNRIQIWMDELPPSPSRPQGQWNMLSQHGTPPTYVYSCSECNHKSFGFYNYCPNCGAYMQ